MVDENKSFPPPNGGKRQIKNFLIDKNYQLGWVARVAAVALLVVGILGYFLYDTLSESIDIVTSNVTVSMTAQASEEFVKRGEAHKTAVLYVLWGSLLGLVVVLSAMTIIVTHKVAGPIYKMRRLLKEINGDRLWLQEKLRRGDELQEVYTEFSNMLGRLRESRQVDIETLESAIALIRPEDREKAAAFQQLVDRYKTSISAD